MALTAEGLLLAREYPELLEAVTALLKEEGVVDSAGEGLLRLQTAGATVLCLSGGTIVIKLLRHPESGLHVVKDLRQAVTAAMRIPTAMPTNHMFPTPGSLALAWAGTWAAKILDGMPDDEVMMLALIDSNMYNGHLWRERMTKKAELR